MSIKYVTLFLANFYPLPLSHIPGPPKKYVTHLGPHPDFLVGLVQKPEQKPLYKFSLNCLSGRVCQRVLGLEGFVRGGFCPFLLLSQNICYNRKLSITLNFMFNMYDKKCISVTSHALDPLCPLSQTFTPTWTPSSPSSVTYFMDGP